MKRFAIIVTIQITCLTLGALASVLIGHAQQPASAPPALTDLETAQVRILTLERALAQAQVQAMNCAAQLQVATTNTELPAKHTALVSAIEATHPGFTLNDVGALVPKSSPEKSVSPKDK